jgi:LPXTG-site transpeptidase (sortase) family protein
MSAATTRFFTLLKDLKKGDDVVIFYKNQRYNYVVTGSKIVDPSNVSYLVNSQNQDKQQLILQTCWPPGDNFSKIAGICSAEVELLL